MKGMFIYSYNQSVKKDSSDSYLLKNLVLFLPYKNVIKIKGDIAVQLRDYFHSNTLPNRLIIICFEFNKTDVSELFHEESDIYDYIPRYNYSDDSIVIMSMNKSGDFEKIHGKLKKREIDNLYNRGMVKIFNENGGLIVSKAHHFQFPSGKHSDRFLRAGNVLINGVEIIFIASALVRHYRKTSFKSIYSDTSSINSLAYAFIGLKKELDPELTDSISVESFGSYQLFERLKFDASKDSLFIISSSTSGSIIDRMINLESRSKKIDLQNISIIFGLNVNKLYTKQVICDLTFNKNNNPEGLETFVTYNVTRGINCNLCESGSKALLVQGDVFLLEKPIVSTKTLGVNSVPNYLKGFKHYYNKKNSSSEPLIRSHFKEKGVGNKKYEIFIDTEKLLNEWKNRNRNSHPYRAILRKIEKHIVQNIPSSTKYLIVLPDKSSKLLAKIILEVLQTNGSSISIKAILNPNRESLESIDEEESGAIVIINSSVVSGRNLLFLSRALRDYELSYQRIYFNLISRTSDKDSFLFLESNIGYGEFGPNTHKIVNVEKLFCTKESHETPWHIEENQIKLFQEFCEENKDCEELEKFCSDRILELTSSGKRKGFSNNLFFPNIKMEALEIRNGFAFAPSQDGKEHELFINNSYQSEVYFIISTILNHLRNNKELQQSEYTRTLIDPGNFIRFNDGIIQASLLRAATREELNYSLSDEESFKMRSVLEDMILHIEDEHAEALNEFLYAIAINKLKLSNSDLKICVNLLLRTKFIKTKQSVAKGILKFIQKITMKK